MWSRRAGAVRLAGAGTVVLVCLSGIAGCGGESKSAGEIEPTAAPAGRQASPPLRTLRGSLAWGHEVRSFRECGAAESSWIVDETGGELRLIYEQLAAEPYQELFFEVRGAPGPAVEAGFAADYPSSVTVHEVRRAEFEGRGCDDDLSSVEYRAAGTEPFWSLEVLPTGMVLSRPDPPGRLEWPRPASRAVGGSLVLSSTDEAHGAIEVVLTESACTNAMSGARFPFVAELRLAEEILFGCALEGDLVQR